MDLIIVMLGLKNGFLKLKSKVSLVDKALKKKFSM